MNEALADHDPDGMDMMEAAIAVMDAGDALITAITRARIFAAHDHGLLLQRTSSEWRRASATLGVALDRALHASLESRGKAAEAAPTAAPTDASVGALTDAFAGACPGLCFRPYPDTHIHGDRS